MHINRDAPMSQYFPALTSDTETAIAKLADEVHSTWLILQSYLCADEWLVAYLHCALKIDVLPSHLDCLRSKLAQIEMTLSNKDREELKTMASRLRNASIPVRLSDPAFCQQIAPFIAQRFSDRPMTNLRFQRLVMQLTNYSIGFGDLA